MPRKGATVDLIDLYKRARKDDDEARVELSILSKQKFEPAKTCSNRTRHKSESNGYGTHYGRRHCLKCSHWLYVTDFGVEQWTDSNKTRPKTLKSQCFRCLRNSKRCKGEEARLKKKQQEEQRLEAARVIGIIKRMSRETRIEYELKGVLPILPRGVVMEDFDPTPVPTGCPECWRRDGSLACRSCPDPQTKEKRRIYLREVKQQGLALPV